MKSEETLNKKERRKSVYAAFGVDPQVQNMSCTYVKFCFVVNVSKILASSESLRITEAPGSSFSFT